METTLLTLLFAVCDFWPFKSIAAIYSNLYNKVDLDIEFTKVKEKILQGVNAESIRQYNRITHDVVEKAISLLKPKKNDAIFNISSDFYLNGPSELVIHLTSLLKLFFSHGYVPKSLLMCTLIPLIKDNLGDIIVQLREDVFF